MPIQQNYTKKIDGWRRQYQLIFKPAGPQQRLPGGHFLNFIFWLFRHKFKTVWRNLTKLLIYDGWEGTSTPADFRALSPTAATPGGYFSDFAFFTLFSKLLEGIWWNFEMEISHKWSMTPADIRTRSPSALPPGDQFYIRFWFWIFVLIFKTVLWNLTKLHTNDRYWWCVNTNLFLDLLCALLLRTCL